MRGPTDWALDCPGCHRVRGRLGARDRIGLFPVTRSYPSALALLVLAGIFNIAFSSMAQTLVQILAPPRVRGRVVGLFNTAALGLRAGSGLTVGILGAFITVQWSLILSSAVVATSAVVLFALELRPLDGHHRHDGPAEHVARASDAGSEVAQETARAESLR